MKGLLALPVVTILLLSTSVLAENPFDKYWSKTPFEKGYEARERRVGEVPHIQVRAIAMNLAMLSGYYSECAKKNIVKGNRQAIRFAAYSAGKYAEITGDRNTVQSWANDGRNGYLIMDPSTSSQKKRYPMSNQYCALIKQHLDNTWNVFRETIVQ